MSHEITTNATSYIDDTMESSAPNRAQAADIDQDNHLTAMPQDQAEEHTLERAFKASGNTENFANPGSRPTSTRDTRPSVDTFSDFSMFSGDVSSSEPRSSDPLFPPSPPAAELRGRRKRSLRNIVLSAWIHSKGMLMVILAQFFGASMNVMTQLLERNGSHGEAMHPFQILFARMFITAVASYGYMWYTRVPNPFGAREVRWLLVARAVGGFFGVFGMYFSLLYMPLAEATVLTFLAPIVACYACSFLMPNEPFTRKQQLAGLISLLGVVLIARPFSGGKVEDDVFDSGTVSDDNSPAIAPPTAYQHLLAIAFGLLGVLGAACAYTTIRLIGSRAHPLVSVTYFSVYTTIISLIAMLAIPSVSFRLPGNAAEWGLLIGLGITGFTMQYLLTAGLAYKPSPSSLSSSSSTKGHGTRATSMVYTQMLFALLYDKVVMHTSPSVVSWAGSGLILGCAIYVATVRDSSSSSSSNSNNTMLQEGVNEDRGPALEHGHGHGHGLGLGIVVDREEGKDVEEGRALLREGEAS